MLRCSAERSSSRNSQQPDSQQPVAPASQRGRIGGQSRDSSPAHRFTGATVTSPAVAVRRACRPRRSPACSPRRRRPRSAGRCGCERHRRRRAVGACRWRRRARARRVVPLGGAHAQAMVEVRREGIEDAHLAALAAHHAPAARSSWRENSEQVMRPVRPSAKRKSAVIQRSTFGRGQSRASARTTSGSAAGEEAQQVDGVAADVHRRAAGQVVAVADVAGKEQRDAHRRSRCGAWRRARRNRRSPSCAPRAGDSGSGTPPPAGGRSAPRRQHHLRRLIGVRGDRLLAQDVLARLQRADAPLGVQAVGQRVVDRVDLRIGDQRRRSWAVHAGCRAWRRRPGPARDRAPRPRRWRLRGPGGRVAAGPWA